MSLWKKYGFAWVTIGFFLISLAGHWMFAWFAYVNEQAQHAAPVSVSDYLVVVMRDTLENWQSEFLQLVWQVVGLTILLYVGSPQSRDSEDRSEELLKSILREVAPDTAEKTLTDLEQRFPSR